MGGNISTGITSSNMNSHAIYNPLPFYPMPYYVAYMPVTHSVVAQYPHLGPYVIPPHMVPANAPILPPFSAPVEKPKTRVSAFIPVTKTSQPIHESTMNVREMIVQTAEQEHFNKLLEMCKLKPVPNPEPKPKTPVQQAKSKTRPKTPSLQKPIGMVVDEGEDYSALMDSYLNEIRDVTISTRMSQEQYAQYKKYLRLSITRAGKMDEKMMKYMNEYY